MAKVTEVSFTFALKRSDGNFGSMCFEATESAELEPGDDLAAFQQEQRNRVVARVVTEFNALGQS